MLTFTILVLGMLHANEFVGDGYRQQKTTYSDGTTVTVNFDTDEATAQYGNTQQ